MPPHKLQRLTVLFISRDKDHLEVFPLDCAEHVVLIFAVLDLFFLESKAKQLPPHVPSSAARPVRACPCPISFHLKGLFWTIEFSAEFGVDELRAFKDK